MMINGCAGEAHDPFTEVQSTVLDTLATSGATHVRLPVLQPAADLLAHYGEELRGRACVLADTHGGELFLVPDYTVPICRYHLNNGAEAGRYVYSGPVFRPPAPGASATPIEEWQTGLELYTADKPIAATEAELLRLVLEAIHACGVTPTTITLGDATLGREFLTAVPMPDHQRERLIRRWAQPIRFDALLDRFAGVAARPQSLERDSLLRQITESDGDPLHVVQQILTDRQIPQVGRRRLYEIATRLTELAAERNTEPLADRYVAQLKTMSRIRSTYDDALASLQGCAAAVDIEVASTLTRLANQKAGYVQAGIDADLLHFDMGLGGELGYYDGFVFEVRAGPQRTLVANGGRYDSLPKAFGAELGALGAALWIERLLACREGGES